MSTTNGGPAEAPAPQLSVLAQYVKDFSFEISPGQVVGIVGRSGSGKTTITRLIQGLYRPQTGLIKIDGQDLKELELGHLRTQIGVVLQENFLFRATVRENIAMT